MGENMKFEMVIEFVDFAGADAADELCPEPEPEPPPLLQAARSSAAATTTTTAPPLNLAGSRAI
jgi:hypothetical protein